MGNPEESRSETGRAPRHAALIVSEREPADSDQGQFSLLKQRRFGPFFVTQFIGAFNDNVYKNALIALVTFQLVRSGGPDAATLVNIAAGLFILPFFLFSAFAGQIADKYEKSWLIRRIKLAEIMIMLIASVGLVFQNLSILYLVLFMMGTQSTFFGPVKYGILPQHLKQHELVGGNGLVEMGTFLAILLGTIAGTRIITFDEVGPAYTSVAVVLLAAAGYLASRAIPQAPASDASLNINWNPLSETWRLVAYTYKNRVLFQSILGISWFWLLGALYLAQFPVYSRDVLGGNVGAYTLLLALFSIGIAVGSVLCEKLSDHRVEIGLVPFGAIGLTLFGLDLWHMTPIRSPGTELSIISLIFEHGLWRLFADVLLLGVFGGFYIVPLYALIQQRSRPDRLSRAIACNNILNALAMVLSALLALALFGLGFDIRALFLVASILNALVAIYIFSLVPEFLMRFMTWLLIHTVYRVDKQGLRNIPDQGPVVLASNHVSFVDPLIIGGCVRRPVRFVMYYKIYRIPLLHFVFRTARAIPIAGRREDEAMYHRAFEEMEAALENGDILCIFPEGQITWTGELNEFRPGLELLLSRKPVPVIPVALQGLWGSMFSRRGGRAFFKLPRRLFARIALVMGEPIPGGRLGMPALQQKVLDLRGDRR